MAGQKAAHRLKTPRLFLMGEEKIMRNTQLRFRRPLEVPGMRDEFAEKTSENLDKGKGERLFL